MFEGLVRQLILGYLGKYIKDIQKDQLKITLWNEEVLLENVELILEAFDYLQLPFAFRQGRVGKLSIKIPWKKLGWDPVIIILEDVYICVSQRDDTDWCTDAIERREYASKKAQLAAAELAKLSRRVCDNHTGKSFISYITAKILDSIQVTVRNVHVLYRDTLSATEEILFGLKFSSLTVMRQTPGSSIANIGRGQVNKLIEVQSLELYCDIRKKNDGSSTKNGVDYMSMGMEKPEDNKYSSMLAPLNVVVSLSVKRSGKLLDDAPQYTINIELGCVETSMNEVQLQQILSLCDYMSLSRLREKYGRYRPLWGPLAKRLKGWQKAWWNYAQESVLSDVRRRLRKTSWKYFGERLNARRKYVNLYKAKLKCLRHDQVIKEDVQHGLEKMEKETDIEDILNYRSVAEHELEDFLVNSSTRYGSNCGNMDKLEEDDRPPSKPRGWLNWLSYGMLGAGGTDDSNQFSGVISDDVIKDIYEATKFHPAPVLLGDSALMDDVYFSSLNISISEIRTTLRSMELGRAIFDLMLTGIFIEGKVWEKSAIITASVNSAHMLDPIFNRVVLFTKKVKSADEVLGKEEPSLNVKVDFYPSTSDLSSSVKVIVGSIELCYDSEFVKNIVYFLYVLRHLRSQQERILLSLNGMDDLNSRLLSKIDYVLSSRTKMILDINFLNTVINIPWEDVEAHNTVIEVAAISFTSKSEIDSSISHMGDRSHPMRRYVGLGPGFVVDTLEGFQLHDLYDHFDIKITDAQITLAMPSSITIPFIEKFSASASLLSCVLPDEPILKELEVRLQVPSLIVHFSASIYGEIVGLISQLPLSVSTASVELQSTGLKTSVYPWFSIDANLDMISLVVNLEGVTDGCTLNFCGQRLGVWFDQRDFPKCWASVQACRITATSIKDDWLDHVLFSSGSKWVSELTRQHNMGVDLDGQNGHLGDGSSVVDGCIVLHFELLRTGHCLLQNFTVYATDLDIHCYPFIVGQLVEVLNKITVLGESDIEVRNPDVESESSSRHDFEIKHDGLSSEIGLFESTNILLDHFSFMESPKMFSAPFVNSNIDADSSVQTSIDSELRLVNLNLGSITLYFHDSSCIVGTVVVPLAKLKLKEYADSLGIVCSTEGMALSSSWWNHTLNEFLWGPTSSNLSPILNLHLKKTNTRSRNPQFEINFNIQQVSCMLTPEILAMFIGYFSLPDWSSCSNEQPDVMGFEVSSTIKYNFEIVDCNIVTPANNDCSEFLKVNIKQLRIAYSEKSDRSSVTMDIPSACCINAGSFSDRNHCLDFSGCDMSLSLLLSEKDVINSLNRCQNLVLVASLGADVWVRIPCDSESDLVSYPVCIMAMVNDCQLDIEEVRVIIGFSALGFVIDQFSLVEEESKLFTFDVPHFLQSKKQMMDNAALVPKTSDVTYDEMQFCVKSLSLRLHQLKRDSTCSETVAEAEMHFVCSLSLMNGKPRCLDISFSSLALFSLLNCVVLAQFACPGPGSSALDIILSVSDYGENRVFVSCPCLDVWLHMLDWNKVIDVVSSFTNQLPRRTSSAAAEDMSSILVGNAKDAAADTPNHVARANISDAAVFSTLTLEHLGLAVHFPGMVSRYTNNTFGRAHFHNEQPMDDYCSVPSGNKSCFLSFSLQSRNNELVADGKTVKLTISSENLNGTLELFTGDCAQTWPLFQLSKIHLEAEISEYETENVHTKLSVGCDSLDVSLSNHILYLFHFSWFEKSEQVPSQFNLGRIDLKVQLRKLSLLLTDWKTSNGPLLEILVRNSFVCSTVIEDKIDGSVGCELQMNYYSIDKVLWEPFMEPWKIQLRMSRKQDERALFSGAIMTDINLESKTHLNLNLNESIIEVFSRTIEMIGDAWSLLGMAESSDLSNSQLAQVPETRRYAPYMLQNLTTLPLVFCVCQRRFGREDLDVSPSKGLLQPGSSTLVHINESPEDLLFRYRPMKSSDTLNENQLLEAAHRHVTFQLEGTSVPSALISMDLVGRRYFEVEFSQSSHVSEVRSDANSMKRNEKVEGDGGTDAVRGFAIPVVIDVSVQRFTKLIRLYSTVVILNSTSVLIEVRFDIPFGVAPKILGPIYPGQEFPLPLHLAEAGCIRWRPLGDSYLWSEAYNMSSIISKDVKIGFLRSFVCYPSHPSSEAFRCCITVNNQCLPPVGRAIRVNSSIDFESVKQTMNFHVQSSNSLEIPRNRFLYQVMLTSPLVLKNYLMKSVSVTLENAGVTRTAFLSEVETPFYHIDSSHDLSITFQMHGFRPSTLKYPRAESFSGKAKFSGTKFSLSEIIRFDPESSDGPLYVTMDKVMDAVSGAREIFISVPFLLYNCTGFSLVLSNSVNEMRGYSCIIPSSYNMDEQNVFVEKKDGLGLIYSDQNFPGTGSTSETNSSSSNFVQSGNSKLTTCLFSPDPHSYSGEAMVKLSRYLPSVIENVPKCAWSAPFSLVPPTGSTSVLVPRPSMAVGYVLSISAMAAPFSGRTKIITFQPRFLIANACTKNLCYKQKGTDYPFVLGAGRHSYIQWMDSKREFLLSVRFDEPGWEWSGCFLPEQLGDTQVKVRNYMTAAVSMMRVEVRSADVSVGEGKIVGSTSSNSGTNLILLSVDDTGFMPYRIDNHSRERLRIYQPKCESFETVIHPYTSSPYAWDEPCYPHRLVVEVPGERILGSYAIDDASAHSLVCLPATSEKPERNLLISVHSEGAIKVLSIIDSSYHVLDDLKSLHVPQLKDKRRQTRKFESFLDYKERFSIDLPFLGVSLMNSRPEELLFACAKNVKVNFVQSLDQQQFSLLIASLQIDNQLRTTPYPVIMSFNRGNKGNLVNQVRFKDNSAKPNSGDAGQIASSDLHEPVFSLAVAKWRNNDTSLVSFESISLRIGDFYLEIEQEIVLRLFEFFKSASSRLQSRVLQHVDSMQNMLFSDSELSGEPSINVQYSARLDEKHPNCTDNTLLSEDYKRSCLLPHIVPIGAPWQQIHLAARKQKKIYVELFDMGPIKVTLSNEKMQSQFSSYIIIFFLFFFPLLRVAAYELVASDRISINCGSPAATSTALSGREWVGDDVPNPKFSIKGSSSSSRSVLKGDQTVAVDPVPYNTARVSRSQFTYTFRRLGSPGQKLIRLHFNPSSTESFNDYFTVEAGPFTLLANFSPSINARALSLTNLVKEFCLITTHENQPLNIIFTPFQQQQKHSYAFINGLEIISLPSTLSNCHGGDIGVRVVGQKSVVHIDHTTALETIQRLNFKWDYVPLSSDNIRGMFGMWPTILKQKAYNNNNNNITWKTSVDVGFRYLVRLHFSEMGIKMADNGHKDFVLLINHMIATTGADILREGDERHTSLWYKNYMVMVQGHKRESKHDFLISLCSKDEFFEENIPLEGFEIFKLSNLHNSLAGPNPLTPPTTTSRDSLSTNNILVSVLGFRNAIATIVVTIICLLNIIFHFLRQNWESQLSDEDLMPSNRAKQLCRHFSLFEIESATVNFNDAYVIGKGGFGKVYKGLIDNEQQIVAIKRLKSDSNQGMREFWTEIEILSELRHVNLVSLIGYCNNPPEMIIVYEYMPRGTLADHLYKLARKNNNNNNNNASSLLSWKQRLNICIGAGRGLDYLHTGHGIIHRDVKTSNILLDENSVAKVSDFGLAKTESGSELQSLKGSFGYFDPDYYSTRILTTKSDVYSFGVVLLEVLCGRPAVEPMADEDERSLNMWARDKINKGEVEQIVDPSLRGEISPNSLKAFVRVAERCLRDEPKKRPAMANVCIRLQFALKQQENAESLVPSNEITSVADFFPSNNGNANSSAPNASDDVVVTSAQQAEEKSVLPDEIITTFVSNVLSRSDKTSLSVPFSSNVRNVTSTLKEQSYSGMINARKRDGRKRVMHKLLRLLPWNAFSSIAKPSKKKVLFSVSAPMASRNTRNTSNFSLIVNNTFAEKRVSESYELMPTPNLRVFSISELKAATRNFKSDRVLGEGGFGKVYKGWIDDRSSAIAVKRLNSESMQGFQEWQSEVNLLGRLSHPNLVKLLGYGWEDAELFLIYEFMQKGNLENHLFGRGSAVQPIPWDTRVHILIGAARGLAFLHSSDGKVIYRDFKASNILLDRSYNAKISDFGLVRLGPTAGKSHVSTQVMGTYGYAAPEYVATGRLYVKSDVYCFGVVLVEMLTGLRALDQNRPFGLHTLVDWIKPHLSDQRLKHVMDSRLQGIYPSRSALHIAKLALRCLEGEPKNRPPMQEIVETLERIDSANERPRERRMHHSAHRPAAAGQQQSLQYRSPLHPRQEVNRAYPLPEHV